MEKEINRVSIILTTRNTSKYIRLSVESLRKDKFNDNFEIIIMDDNSKDGTKAWLKYYADKLNFKYVTHNKPKRKGLMILTEEALKIAKNDIVFLGHSDMGYGKDCIKNLLKYMKPKTVVCSTRIEPPIYPEESIRYTRDYGNTADEFKLEEFEKEVERLKKDVLTEGVFAPTMINKKDFYDINGYDKEFIPNSREDSDLFYRLAKNGVKFYQSWSSIVYHFSGKGSRKKDSLKDSEEWQKTNYKNTRNFIRIYGELPNHLDKQPIVKDKIKLTLCVATHNDEDRISNFLEIHELSLMK